MSRYVKCHKMSEMCPVCFQLFGIVLYENTVDANLKWLWPDRARDDTGSTPVDTVRLTFGYVAVGLEGLIDWLIGCLID